MNPFREKVEDQYLVLKYDDFEKHFPSDALNQGSVLHVAAGGGRAAMDKPEYLIVNWEKFDKFKVVIFCNFMQHPENGKCVDNERDQLYIGLPLNWN